MKRSLLLTLALATVGVLGIALGCGAELDQQETSPQPVETQPQPTVVYVEILNFSFRPNVVDVPAGSTVTWTNRDAVNHSITHRNGSMFDGVMQKRGGTFSYTFHQPGVYEYYDRIQSQAPSGVVRVH